MGASFVESLLNSYNSANHPIAPLSTKAGADQAPSSDVGLHDEHKTTWLGQLLGTDGAKEALNGLEQKLGAANGTDYPGSKTDASKSQPIVPKLPTAGNYDVTNVHARRLPNVGHVSPICNFPKVRGPRDGLMMVGGALLYVAALGGIKSGIDNFADRFKPEEQAPQAGSRGLGI